MRVLRVFPTVGDLGVISALVAWLPTLTQEGARGVGGRERPKCLATDRVNLLESTTSVAQPKNYLFPTNPSISVYIDSLNSNDIFLVLAIFFLLLSIHPPPITWTRPLFVVLKFLVVLKSRHPTYWLFG